MTISPVTAQHSAATATPPPGSPPSGPPPSGPPPGGAKSASASQSSSQSGKATSTAQQQAALTQMLAKYARDQSHGVDGATLSALGKQIIAAAKALGQHVTLPKAPATTDTSAASASVSQEGKVDVTA